MSTHLLQPNQIRKSHTIRDILPIFLVWIIFGIIFLLLFISTIPLNQVISLLDGQPIESTTVVGVSGLDTSSGSNEFILNLPAIFGPLSLLLIGLVVVFSGIYMITIYDQPLPLKNLLSESMLHLIRPKTSSDKKIILDLSFGLLSLSWTKTRGLPRSWTITLQLDTCNTTALCLEFAESLLMNRLTLESESPSSLKYYKTIKAHTWPHIEYLLRYWLKNLSI